MVLVVIAFFSKCGWLLRSSQLPSNLYFNRQSRFGRRVSDKVISVNVSRLK